MRPDVTRWLDRRTSHGADWPLAEVLAAKGAHHASAWSSRPSTRSRPSGPSSAAIHADLVRDRPPARRRDRRHGLRQQRRHRGGGPPGRGDGRQPGRRTARHPRAARQGRGAVALAGGDQGRRARLHRRRPRGLLVLRRHRRCSARCCRTARSRWSRGSTTGRCATANALLPAGGGRVTELVARPLLNLHWPELAGVVQPLAGRVRRPARPARAAAVPDRVRRRARAAHRHPRASPAWTRSRRSTSVSACTGTRTTRALGRMAAEIWQAALRRLDPTGRTLRPHGLGATLAQFERDGDELVVVAHDVSATERPPMIGRRRLHPGPESGRILTTPLAC